MKQTLLIILGITILISTSFLPENESNIGVLGDVKYSILPPDEFKELNGKSWRLINGDNISDTDLFILWINDDNINVRLPNLSNKFIRSMGDKNRVVGSEQEFATALPDSFALNIPESGDHSHEYSESYYHHEAPLKDGTTRDNLGRNRTVTTGNGKHKHSVIISGGAIETRPINIAFYTYIKVKK